MKFSAAGGTACFSAFSAADPGVFHSLRRRESGGNFCGLSAADPDRKDGKGDRKQKDQRRERYFVEFMHRCLHEDGHHPGHDHKRGQKTQNDSRNDSKNPQQYSLTQDDLFQLMRRSSDRLEQAVDADIFRDGDIKDIVDQKISCLLYTSRE